MNKFKLRCGDNIELLKKLPDNSVDAIVSDPPYGLSFMNKKWDYDVPSVEFWKEVYRVLKPGGHVLSFGGTRTYHRMVVNIEDAGFEIRDQIMWLYGSGFPKSHNIGKAVDKLNGLKIPKNKMRIVNSVGIDNYDGSGSGRRYDMVEYDVQNEYEGWGTALKPANEPICLARKPLSEKSVAENVLKWRTGGINVDGCRIGYEDTPNAATNPKYRKENGYKLPEPGQESNGAVAFTSSKNEINTEGRFPANIILECICDELLEGDTIPANTNYNWSNTKAEESNTFTGRGKYTPREDKLMIHTNPMCPCRLMDEQSGISSTNCKAGTIDKVAGVFQSEEGKSASGHKKKVYPTTINDKGGASRYFYQAKVSKKERNMGLDGFEDKKKWLKGGGGSGISDRENVVAKNNHPTVKPVQLMSYLCRLITPPGGTILDPFMGSGSTGIAALLEGFNFIGFDLDPDYVKIAEARISNYEKYREFLKK